MKNNYDAIVIGGGVNGGSVAYQLAKRGKRVLLLEKDRIASKASSAAAGMLAAQAELNEASPLFLLAKNSREMFSDIAKEIKELTNIDIELINKGMLKVALNEEEVQEYHRIIETHREVGEQAEWLDLDEVKRCEPYVSNHVLGAMYIEKDGHVSAPHLTLGFVKAAAILGATIKEFVEVKSLLLNGKNVSGVSTNEGNYYSENVIVTAGAWSNNILNKIGLNIEGYPVKGECFSVLTNQPLLTSTIFSHGCYLVPKKGGRIIVGATMKTNTFSQVVTVDGINLLLERAKKLLPRIVDAEWEKAWAGIRPQTTDGMPYLGEHPSYNGLFVATGHFRNGILLSAITGEIIADLVERKEATVDITPFRLDRSAKIHV